jgi:prolipoprotein diacylglyceryltransferase
MAKSAASKLFDLRILIGGLFTFYGVALVIYSFFTTPEELAKAAGININLWLGLAMLLLGVIFLLWARLSPVVHEAPSDDDAGAARPPMH